MKTVSTLTAATILVAMATSLRAGPQPSAAATVADGNVALASGGATVSGAFLEGWPGAALIDGNTTDYDPQKGYAASPLACSWVVTLPRTYLLSELRLLLYDKDERFYRYVVETSLDGKTYHTAADRSQGQWRSWQKLTFKPRPVRYIRFHGLYNSYGPLIHVVELEAYCKPVALGKPKWDDSANWGKIAMLIPHRGGVYFRLGGGQTTMEPRLGYYFLKTSHPNYQAMYDLLYKTGEKRRKIGVGTQQELDKSGFAVVEYMVVTFPADD